MPAKSTILGFGLVAVFLGSLFLAPKVFVKKKFNIDVAKDAEIPPSLPLDYQLERLVVENRKVRKAGTVKVRELLGNGSTPLILNFWATWCPPCIEEIPSLELLSQKLALKEVGAMKLVAVSVDESVRDIQKFIESFDFVPTFVIVHDPSGGLAKVLGTSKFPETFLVDGKANLRFKWAGPQDWLSHDVASQLASLFKP